MEINGTREGMANLTKGARLTVVMTNGSEHTGEFGRRKANGFYLYTANQNGVPMILLMNYADVARVIVMGD